MSLRFTASKTKRADRLETEEEEEVDGRELPAERQLRKKRKMDVDEYIRNTTSLIDQHQALIDWYESTIPQDPEQAQAYRRVIDRNKAIVQQLQQNIMTLQFERL